MPTIEQARSWYSPADPVHGFEHVLRVLRLAEQIAQAEGADLEIVRAAALLHDAVAPAAPAPAGPRQSAEASRLAHHLDSANFAGQVLAGEGWPGERIAAVQHCIRAHRFRDRSVQPQSLEAQVLFDADKLDAIGAIGVARAVAYAARAGQPAYAAPSQQFIQGGQLQPGEPHSAYHEYIFKLCKLKDRLHTPAARRLAEARHNLMAGFFERLRQEIED